METRQLLSEKREEIYRIARQHGVRRLRVFGSVARAEDTPESDIDFLIETGPETSAWFPAGLILDLEDLLQRKVEVVTEGGLHPALRTRVLEEAVPL